MTELVTALGHAPSPVTRGRDALRAAELVRPDVVLLDLGLPDLDGYEIARQLRASSSACDALLVAVTGFGTWRDIERSRAAGFDQHVIKPAGLPELGWILDESPAPRPSLPSLLIVDEPLVASSLARILAGRFTIATASSRAALVHHLDSRHFDRILCAPEVALRLGADLLAHLCACAQWTRGVIWMLGRQPLEVDGGTRLPKPFGRAALYAALGEPLAPWAYRADLERRDRADALLATLPLTARAAS